MSLLSVDLSDLASRTAWLVGWLDAVLGNGTSATLAIVVLAILTLIGRASARRRIGVLEAELARIQMQMLGVERLQYEADQTAMRAEARLHELERAQQRAADRSRKPDPKLAMAMARAGADVHALVDCGLSHAESHLVRALHAPPPQRPRPETFQV